jgi:hypothetical protein
VAGRREGAILEAAITLCLFPWKTVQLSEQAPSRLSFQCQQSALSGSCSVFALSSDGQRMQVNQLLEESNRTPISVVAKWDAELNKK